jgi:hypothetical protein
MYSAVNLYSDDVIVDVITPFVKVRVVTTPINVKKLLNSSRVYPSGRHGNMSRRSLEFEKIPAFLCTHGLGRHLAPVRTNGQHCLDEILDKETACIQSASVRTPWQHCPDTILDKTITCRQFATVQTLG